MEKGAKGILIFGGLVLLLRQTLGTSSQRIPYTPPPTNYGSPPGSIPIAGGSDIPTGPAGSATQAAANQNITQTIGQQNLDITAAGSIATTAIGVLASAHVLALSIAGPIGAAIAAAVILVKLLISDVHLYANELVQKYQNPFGNSFISVIGAISDALNAHTLTTTQVNAAYTALSQSWSIFESQMHQLQNSSRDWYIVATQALNDLDNQYIGTTLPNGKVLGVGMGGVYGDTLNYGFVSSWLDWLKGLMTDPDVIDDSVTAG